ncbi:unnamed protein product [Caenorhabditis sp. 36 PRJEB53466]|nr:unnamed protein product [Caenorhabditis sp. 36 PRJEB53466]
MSIAQFQTLKKHFESILTGDGNKAARQKIITSICELYDCLGRDATSQQFEKVYELYELSKHIFKAANQEVTENDERWQNCPQKENKTASRLYKTKLFELSIYHLKNCCQQKLDHNNVPWIQYCLAVLQKSWIRSEVSMECELSACLLSCANASQLHWAQHNHLKRLWEFIWERIAEKTLDMSILKNYVELAVKMMKEVEMTVFEKSPFHIVRIVVHTLKRIAESVDSTFWAHSRKYSFVYILSYVVHRWGVAARDLILRDSIEIINHLKTLMTVEHSGMEDSKTCMMMLIDDLIKLAMVKTVGKHRTMDEETEENMKDLVRTAITETLKSAHGFYFSKAKFSLYKEYVKYLARWIIALRVLEPPPYDESFEMVTSSRKKNDYGGAFTFKGLVSLSFGESISPNVNKCNAWNGAMQIIREVIASQKLSYSTIGLIISSLWAKRKAFTTDELRATFCSLLASTTHPYVMFGKDQIPSIDLLLKYALSLMPNVTSLPSSAYLIECIIRSHPQAVTKEMHRAICDTVSRTNPSSLPVLRLLSAFISYTEFEEGSRFSSINDDAKGSWSLRKDTIDWLLVDLSANSHPLLYQLCRYHPTFCYEMDQPIHDDLLLQSLKQCQLVSSPQISAVSPFRPIDATIDEMVCYVHGELQHLLSLDLSLPVFVLCYEFSLKCQQNLFDFSNIYKKIEKVSETLEDSEFQQAIETITVWPDKLSFPNGRQSPECLIAFFIANLSNQLIELNAWYSWKNDIVPLLAERVKNSPGLRSKVQQAMPFNHFVKLYILDNVGDLYETAKRFVDVSFLLSHRNMLATRTRIRNEAAEQLKSGESITEDDMTLIENMTASACVRNVTGSNRIGGYQLDALAVAHNPNHVFFDDRSLVLYLRMLRKSPFLAQNIVRHVVENEEMWHLHGKLLKYVVKDECLLTVCIATIPDIVRYLKVYQVLLNPDVPVLDLLRFNTKSIAACQKYIRKPKQNADSITPGQLIILFGCDKNKWARVIVRFWKLFEKEPAFVCERLYHFAKRCVALNLLNRIVALLKAISTSEFCINVLKDEHLRTVYKLVYRSIFTLITDKTCRTEIVESCMDERHRYDLFEHQIKKVPAEHTDKYMNFENEVSFSVEKFLQYGIETDNVDFTDFGLTEFYKQLNDNLSEEIIKTSESRGKYMVDFLAFVWLQLPSMRPRILPIVARFKHISPAWARFPQPPHVTADEHTFVFKLRFVLAMKMMANDQIRSGELSTSVVLLLTTYDRKYSTCALMTKSQYRRKNLSSGMLPMLIKTLRKQLNGEEKEMIDGDLFETVAQAASLIREVAACFAPFLFKICVDVKACYDFALSKLLEGLAVVNKREKPVIFCLAECVDSMGLNVLARFERLPDTPKGVHGSRWFFVLARLFLDHGFLTHAFAIANLIFDRLVSNTRNVMMIDRISLEEIEHSDQMIALLVDIYVAQDNSVALGSLPSFVQTRPDVRQVMFKNSKEWIRLVSTSLLDSHEMTIARWMCGLHLEGGEKYLDSILHCRFSDYPKLVDSPIKFVYFLLYHHALGTDISVAISELTAQMMSELSINDVRLLMLVADEANFAPESIEEHVMQAIRDLRDTAGKRKRMEFQQAKVNEKTVGMVKVAEILAQNNAHEAASLLMNKWHEECLAWNSPSVDVALVEVCQSGIMCRAGDYRMAEINLRAMQPQLNDMSDVAVAELTLVLSKITLEYRNDLDEGIRILEKGCNRLKKRESVEARLRLLLEFHLVCMNQLSKLEEYRESRSFRMKQQAITAFEQQLTNSSRLGRANSEDEGSKRAVSRVKKEHQCEKEEVEKVQISVVTAAVKAVSSAFDALECISRLNDTEEAIRTASLIVFPLIDVIYKYEQSPEVVVLLKDHCTKLCSKLWLCATSHIASKCFSAEPSPLRRYLYQILFRMICDYPYHVLHTVFMYESGQSGSTVTKFLNSVLEKRTQWDVNKLREIVTLMREVHLAYRELARLETRENHLLQKVNVEGKTMLRLPSDLKVLKCRLDRLPIPTISQKIGRAGDYTTTGLITWKAWKDVFSIADGLSAPKIWEIQGSDKKWYKTVWKKDDVRQDVLVEQMFDVTNNMLEKRTLRTYNVVPLDTECGIIEFCGGTISIKEMLCGITRDKGLHSEFNPDEPTATKVSLQMRNSQQESTESRRRVFVDICKVYSPVFRHFFYTNFPTAHIWREKIANYRKSLATWSVVCYIVGLGDRHASNILFDQNKCTFVHIDLGMILEYSKRTLPVPERVPFRLSRDLLDPILIEGIENGQLADECIVAIEKLKQNGKVILGVASALLRETTTNFREAEQANGRPSYISEMAIGRLRDKLEGTDDGVTAQSSDLQANVATMISCVLKDLGRSSVLLVLRHKSDSNGKQLIRSDLTKYSMRKGYFPMMNRYLKLLFVVVLFGCFLAYSNLFNRSFFLKQCRNATSRDNTVAVEVPDSLDVCRGREMRNCVPPLRRFKQMYRTATGKGLTACVIEKTFSTFLTAIMCFLNDQKTFLASNRTLDSDIYSQRLCKDKNEFTELENIANWKNMTLFAVVRDPIDRFVSGFTDKCLREKVWKRYKMRCGGCKTNLTCFVDQMHYRMKFFERRPYGGIDFDDSHFFPQSWRCEFSTQLVKYRILQLDSPQFFDELLELFERHGVGPEAIQFINASLHTRTPHSTKDSMERAEVEEMVLKTPYILRKIIQMYYFDFLLFGFKLPIIPHV